MPTAQDDWFTCPVCGEVVVANSLACPHCGADDETGWSDETDYDDVELPDDAFGDEPRRTRQQSPVFAYLVAGLIVVILVVWIIAG